LDLLIQSGALLDLEDHILRHRFTSLPARLADMVDEENELRSVVNQVILPELAKSDLPGSPIDRTYLIGLVQRVTS
jgi:hypothetical protein